MKKKIIIGILVAALVVGGTAGGGVYYRQSHQKTVSVVSVDSLAGDYYADDTTLEGNIVASAVQNISVDKDMIIEKVYVSKGDSVKKDDKLISFDMTLVEMELNIAKLKQQQQEQNLNKAINRLTSLQNGGPVEDSSSDDSSVTPDDTSDTGKDSLPDYDEEASAAGSMNGTYLAAVINPVLAAATGDFLSDGAEETQNTAGTEDTAENSTEDNTSQDQNTSGDTSGGTESSGDEINIDISSGDDNGNNSADDPSEDPDPSETPDPGFDSGQDVSDNIENTDPGTDPGIKDITDGDPVFHQVLDGNTEPYCGKGTKKNPYVFLVSSAKGYAVAKGSFLNKMAGYKPDGTKEDGVDGYWYLLEFHENDTVADVTNRKSSCTGYYLVDGSLLDKMVKDDSEVEFTLDDASHYDNDQDDDPGDDGGDDSGDGGDSSLTREEAIKIQQTKVDSLKLDIRESKINIEKLEKKVKKQTIYSKLDGTVAKVGDAATGSSSGSYFMTVKSKEGFYVKGTVSELMLDEVKEGTKLQCSGSNGDFEADVIDVSEYPVSGDYTGSGNPNVSYYTYLATIPDKSIKVSEDDWLTVTLQGTSQQNGIVLDKAFVRSENGVSYVYKDDNGVLKKQILKVGGNVNGGYSVLVTGGITRDDRIAFPYGDTVKEGAPTQEVSSSDFYGY
nr:hypothetical protein [uncultured Blautia sp.]